jgi:hypothetical protein
MDLNKEMMGILMLLIEVDEPNVDVRRMNEDEYNDYLRELILKFENRLIKNDRIYEIMEN